MQREEENEKRSNNMRREQQQKEEHAWAGIWEILEDDKEKDRTRIMESDQNMQECDDV